MIAVGVQLPLELEELLELELLLVEPPLDDDELLLDELELELEELELLLDVVEPLEPTQPGAIKLPSWLP